jgi:DNA-binding IclR family transcriptional regulator
MLKSKRHLSSLKRGLAALSLLNVEERLTATELGRRIGVPRTTAHRILDTLVDEGYVVHDRTSRAFRLGSQVLRLAQGYSRDSVLADIARPALRALCRDTLTPVGLAAPRGPDVIIQVSMDYEAPLALERLPEGTSFPVTYGPSGHLFLAHCELSHRRQLVAAAACSPSSRRSVPPAPPGDAELEIIRDRGYALSVSRDKRLGEGVLAVPLFCDTRFVASVHLRFMKRVYSPAAALERYLPPLRATAAEIERSMSAVIEAAPELGSAIQPRLLVFTDKAGV